MIRYLKHNEIDRDQWDHCITCSVNRLIYGYSWYLDIVSPGWAGLVEDDYQGVFPLTCKKKFGVQYLYQPLFTQQLGIFTKGVLSSALVKDFLAAIPPQFRFGEIHLNSFNKTEGIGFETVIRTNQELELVQPYEVLARNYSQNAKRNLKKAAEAGVMVKRKVDPEDLINLYRENFGKREARLKYRDYVAIRTLMEQCIRRSKGILMAAGTRDDKPDAAAFFLHEDDRFIFLFSASDYNTRDNGAMFMLIDTFIREHSSRPVILDFEGGNLPNLARFYQGFGARETNYPLIRINRLSPVVKLLLGYYKRLGKH
jgi:hypothetical protein